MEVRLEDKQRDSLRSLRVTVAGGAAFAPDRRVTRHTSCMSIFRRLFGSGASHRDDGDRPVQLPSPDELALLTLAESEFEATMFRDILEQNGITALVKNLDVLTAQSGVMSRPWSQELWVLRKDLRRAREVLELDDRKTTQ